MADFKVGRFRNIGYIVNYNTSAGMPRRYEWAGMKGEKVDIKIIPEEVLQYLMMSTTCFRDGELKVIEDTAEAKEIVENLGEDLETYKNNTLEREEILKLLNGNYKKLESELKKMNKSEIGFVIDVAKEVGIDSSTKQKILAEAVGVPFDILFED